MNLMKLVYIISKNFKVLLRSKTSALMLLAGPLFIIILVGLAFNNQSATQLNVGVASKDAIYTPLAEQFISILSENKFAVTRFQTYDECVDRIKHGTVHACIIFPEKFELSNDRTNELTFYVDQTRTNFVYAIQDAVSSKLALQSTKLSYDLTQGLLNVISETKKTNEDNLVKLLKMRQSLDNTDKELSTIKSKLNSIDLSVGNVSFENSEEQLFNLETSLLEWNDDASSFIENAYGFIDDVVDNAPGADDPNSTLGGMVVDFREGTDNFNESSSDNFNETLRAVSAVRGALGNASKNLDDLQEKLQQAKDTNTDVLTRADNLKKKTAELQADIAAAKSAIESLKDRINALSITNAENIVNPITTKIEPVASTGTNLAYFFPYLVLLIIMLISLLLSSTLVVMEKNSRAYFRNFATPTKDIAFILATFITNFLIVMLELAVILGMAYYFLNAAIFTNIWLVLLLLAVSISLFTVIGMALGYLLKSQEGSMLASIAVGSVFLLLSNLVIPLESMALFVQKAAAYNPYVVASELFRKLLLFKLAWNDVALPFAGLAVVGIAIFLVTVLVQKLAKIRYFTKMPHLKAKNDKVHKDIPAFKMANNVILTSIDDLARELETLDEEIFSVHVNRRKNEFYTWIKDGMDEKELAEKIKDKLDKAEFRRTLLKELNKQ